MGWPSPVAGTHSDVHTGLGVACWVVSQVINQQDANFSTSLELAVRFGKTLVIQEMDHIDPVLFPLLRRDLQVCDGRFKISPGGFEPGKISHCMIMKRLCCHCMSEGRFKISFSNFEPVKIPY